MSLDSLSPVPIDERRFILDMSRLMIWPTLVIRRGERILVGEVGWRAFCGKAAEDQIDRTIAALKTATASGALETPADPPLTGADDMPEQRT